MFLIIIKYKENYHSFEYKDDKELETKLKEFLLDNNLPEDYKLDFKLYKRIDI